MPATNMSKSSGFLGLMKGRGAPLPLLQSPLPCYIFLETTKMIQESDFKRNDVCVYVQRYRSRLAQFRIRL